jgi:hypothetical protein
MRRRVRFGLLRVLTARYRCRAWREPAAGRAGSIQGVNSLVMLIFVCARLYFIARTQVSEPITWFVERVKAVLR